MKTPGLDSFYQLLKARVFYNTDYQSWLLDYMKNATLPIHSKIGSIIHEFVTCTFIVDKVQRIPENIIIEEFRDCNIITPTQVLLLFYVLTHNDFFIGCRTEPKLIALVANTSVEQTEYSTELLDQIPVKYILNHIETYQDGKAYKTIFSDILALSANLYPELFDVTSFLMQEGKEVDMMWDTDVKRRKTKQLEPEELVSILVQHESKQTDVIDALSRLEYAPISHAEEYAKCMISTLLPPCLDETLDSRVANCFVSAWESFNHVIPHSLWTMTINLLTGENHSLSDLIQDIRTAFKCDERVFRSQYLLPIWLHILMCLRTTSKHRIWKRYHSVFSKQVNRNDFNSRNVLALTNAQDTVMLQLLLELCLERPQDKEHPEKLHDARILICNFIHSIFIDGDRDMLLAKILHFQTYPIELIPIMVDLIPSLYIVLGFIPELTRQPQVEKQVFGILLACHLCEKYPLENYLMTAEKHVLPRLLKIAFPVTKEGQPSTVCVPSEFLIKAIPGFVHLARAFPHFGPQILEAFDSIAKGLPQPKEFIGQERFEGSGAG
ncbi:uncharacterized protein RHIMIDRAFT_239493 [Rhizopus microsporus ATCC 52813]|uniref:Integrator complex subunit 2 n=1 Tax=Rhizopus microsporus ATCC 52813 TaxID=1340429 RepID=A0A2G4SPG8_RHIZD|nr:uncharacterized protein RHIMIDRAFT_239493 [Rhizopus microsporus ATCC 52813]PHZ10671.1 hypothetical protein RHIMIDRAFT_239493 [Rhizopus microsporus ATCC 52813]